MTPEPQTEVVTETPATAIPLREVRGEWVATREQWQQEVKARRRTW